MILDTLSNASLYRGLSPRFKEAFEWLASREFTRDQIGKVEIKPDGALFALIQEYPTKPVMEGKWEAHKKYADIQYIVSGEEIIAWDRLCDRDTGEYNDVKDFLPVGEGAGSELSMKAGDFAVFFPDDAHKPGFSRAPGNVVVKVVVKVLLS